MLQKVNIQKLFGRFDYVLEMKSDGVTIITGPNGYGKSTILKIVEAVSKKDVLFFGNLDFESIFIHCSNNQKICVERKANDILRFSHNKQKAELNVKDIAYKPIRRRNPYLRQVSSNTWRDIRTDKVIDSDEMFFYNFFTDDQLTLFEENSNESNKIAKLRIIFENAQECIGEVRLISEQRLIKQISDERRDEQIIVETIDDLPNKLMKLISESSNQYSAVANKLDSSYPKRLLTGADGLKNEKDYKDHLNEAQPKFDKLRKYDLADISLLEAGKYNSKYSEALKIYFEDFSQKYKVFEVLIAKFELFTQIINERLSFKEIKISRGNGIEIIDQTNPEKKLSLKQLSSGEKQEIVLFYELIFETKSELLLLIDEPEISLHIAWQKKFLDDLLKVVESSKIQVVVATHSPQIISNHWDIQIDLGELYGK